MRVNGTLPALVVLAASPYSLWCAECRERQIQTAIGSLEALRTRTTRAQAEKARIARDITNTESRRRRYDFENGKIEELGTRLSVVHEIRDQLVNQMVAAMRELREGYYCSQCDRSRSEIERGGENFEEHLRRVDGRRVAAPPEKIEAKKKEYQKKLLALEQEAQSIEEETDKYKKIGLDTLNAVGLELNRLRIEASQASFELMSALSAQRDAETRLAALEKDHTECVARADRTNAIIENRSAAEIKQRVPSSEQSRRPPLSLPSVYPPTSSPSFQSQVGNINAYPDFSDQSESVRISNSIISLVTSVRTARDWAGERRGVAFAATQKALLYAMPTRLPSVETPPPGWREYVRRILRPAMRTAYRDKQRQELSPTERAYQEVFVRAKAVAPPMRYLPRFIEAASDFFGLALPQFVDESQP